MYDTRHKRNQIMTRSVSSQNNEVIPNLTEEGYPRLSSLLQTPLDYERDIQTKIDVSRPYYALQNERVVLDKNSKLVQGIACDAHIEMPHGREDGTLTAAEAGRHMAIAGSVASAMIQPKDGKFYYLALEAKMSRFVSSATNSGDYKYASIFAKCTDMAPKTRSCSSEIILEVNPDEDAWFLQVSYVMIPMKVFRKLYGEADMDTISRMEETESPYTNFSGLPNVVQLKKGTRTDSSITCHTTLPPPRPEDCLGHFDKNPALPIAYTFSFISELIAQTISKLSGIPTEFRARGGQITSTHAATTIVCQYVNMKAEELVFAHSFGQHLECDVELLSDYDHTGKTFRAVSRALKEDGSGRVIFTSESVWTLVSASET